jgi:hypothetical protein
MHACGLRSQCALLLPHCRRSSRGAASLGGSARLGMSVASTSSLRPWKRPHLETSWSSTTPGGSMSVRRRSRGPRGARAGLEGIVVWGLHRDTVDIRAIGLPLFSLGAIPTGPQRLDDRPADALDTATVGEWTVTREDVVLGDDDGVLFVPAIHAGELFTSAEKIRDTERRQAEKMRGGESLRSQVRFDRYLARRQETPSPHLPRSSAVRRRGSRGMK